MHWKSTSPSGTRHRHTRHGGTELQVTVHVFTSSRAWILELFQRLSSSLPYHFFFPSHPPLLLFSSSPALLLSSLPTSTDTGFFLNIAITALVDRRSQTMDQCQTDRISVNYIIRPTQLRQRNLSWVTRKRNLGSPRLWFSSPWYPLNRQDDRNVTQHVTEIVTRKWYCNIG